MIYNIIDGRKRRYRWRKINAIIEATSHDNANGDSDQQPESKADVLYEELVGVSLNEAIAWATSEPTPVTLFLYDDGDGVTDI